MRFWRKGHRIRRAVASCQSSVVTSSRSHCELITGNSFSTSGGRGRYRRGRSRIGRSSPPLRAASLEQRRELRRWKRREMCIRDSFRDADLGGNQQFHSPGDGFGISCTDGYAGCDSGHRFSDGEHQFAPGRERRQRLYGAARGEGRRGALYLEPGVGHSARRHIAKQHGPGKRYAGQRKQQRCRLYGEGPVSYTHLCPY